jgi:hypothetical protein
MDQHLTVADLIGLLEDCDPDAEVRLAHQPSWPLQFALAGIATTDDLADAIDDPEPERPADREEPAVVWLVEGQPSDDPYAPTQLWESLRRP